MKCKHCKAQIPDDALFCCYCGEQLKKSRRMPTEIKIPAAVKRGNAWNIYLRAEKTSVTEATKALCEAKARAIRAGFVEQQKAAPKITVKEAVTAYINKRINVLSPSTIRGYITIRDTRFILVSDKSLSSVDWQAAVNAEAADVSARTLKNAWGLIKSVIKENGLEVPEVRLPQVVKKEEPWLDYTQIKTFLSACEGRVCEAGAILALHGLRRSELLAVTGDKIDREKMVIHVEGAVVRGEKGMVKKETNKNQSSRRDVPIMIPRLLELLPDGDKPLVTMRADNLYVRINAVCRSAGLPLVGVHGLRRSFASLCYHLGVDMLTTMRLGGWSDDKICREIYTKLAASDVNSNVQKLRQYYNFTADLQQPSEKCDI